MGKGDKKTPKGKRFAGSHGNARPRKPAAKAVLAAAPKAAKVAKPAAKPAAKAPTRTVVKKAAPAAK